MVADLTDEMGLAPSSVVQGEIPSSFVAQGEVASPTEDQAKITSSSFVHKNIPSSSVAFTQNKKFNFKKKQPVVCFLVFSLKHFFPVFKVIHLGF